MLLSGVMSKGIVRLMGCRVADDSSDVYKEGQAFFAMPLFYYRHGALMLYGLLR